jgi:hypothetical protein
MYASRLPSDGTIAHGSRTVRAEEGDVGFMVVIDYPGGARVPRILAL